MKILVAIKHVLDYTAPVRVKADKTGVNLAGAKMSINPFCQIAVEEALRLKNSGCASEVMAVTVGSKEHEKVLRTAYAMGVDRALHVSTRDGLQPLNIAKLLAGLAVREEAGMLMLGKQAIDDDCNQTGQMCAALLGWPQGTFASKVVIDEVANAVDVTREVDAGMETVRLKLPAVVTTDLRLNTPRHLHFKMVIAAKKMAIHTLRPEDLGVMLDEQVTTLRVDEPAARQPGVIVNSVAELVDKLQNEAKVL